MGLFEFFFPAESQAMSLKKLSDSQNKLARKQRLSSRLNSNESTKNNKNISQLSKRVKQLENDIGFLSLLLSGVITKLDQNEVLHREDLKQVLYEIDGFDGDVDGKLDINELRKM